VGDLGESSRWKNSCSWWQKVHNPPWGVTSSAVKGKKVLKVISFVFENETSSSRSSLYYHRSKLATQVTKKRQKANRTADMTISNFHWPLSNDFIVCFLFFFFWWVWSNKLPLGQKVHYTHSAPNIREPNKKNQHSNNNRSTAGWRLWGVWSTGKIPVCSSSQTRTLRWQDKFAHNSLDKGTSDRWGCRQKILAKRGTRKSLSCQRLTVFDAWNVAIIYRSFIIDI
jgi:hypothetical protein